MEWESGHIRLALDMAHIRRIITRLIFLQSAFRYAVPVCCQWLKIQ